MINQLSPWIFITLEEVVSHSKTGLVRSAAHQGSNREFPYIKMNNIDKSGNFEHDGICFVDASLEEIKDNQLEDGDFIFNTRNSLELVGKCGIYRKPEKFRETPILYNNNLLKIKFNSIDARIVFYWLNSPLGKEKLNSIKSSTTSVAAIYQRDLLKIKVPFPPFAEQIRIAQKLDELLAQIDTLKARIDAIPALLKRFRQSVLAAAISGQITEKWRADAPNCSIEDWLQVTVGDLCQLKSGIAISADLEKTTGDFKYFKVGEMNLEGNEHYLQHTSRYLTKGAAPEKSLMPSGSILFPKRGGAIATNKKRVLKEPSFIDLNIMGIIVPDDVEIMYIFRWLETIDLSKLNTGTTVPQINNTDISPLVVPLPPASEQVEIVRRIEQLFAFADQLETKVASAKSRIDRLTQSILAKAFRGELVPQDPNDEPASVLLERIKAQRAAAPKAKRDRKTSA